MEQTDLFGNIVEKNELLRDRFIEPPFSVLDTKGGNWQNRKRKWLDLGIESEIGRDNITFRGAISDNDFMGKKMQGVGDIKSIFDPVLCELVYNWFCKKGSKILDPFAGGSVRGIIANYLGYDYTGIELREEQVESNKEQGLKILPNNIPKWICGDSDMILDELEIKYDLIFTCPPYYDLEIYSKLREDLSNIPQYYKFIEKLDSIIKKSLMLLKNNSFAVMVVADIRDHKGFYRNFVSDTINCFNKQGVKLYNEAILLNSLGTAMLRVNKQMQNRKLVKVHQNVLIFYKGFPEYIKDKFKLF